MSQVLFAGYKAVSQMLFCLQVKGAAQDAAESSGAKGVLDQAKPKGGFFQRINDEALTDSFQHHNIGTIQFHGSVATGTTLPG